MIVDFVSEGASQWPFLFLILKWIRINFYNDDCEMK